MSVLEREAIHYSNELENSKSGLSNYKRSLSSKIYDFSRERDKIVFLGFLRISIQTKKSAHEENCPNVGKCGTSDDFETMLFAIEQEYENLQNSVQFSYDTEQFTISEKINLDNKIGDILDKLSNLQMGQEILFDELDVLRQHFNLDKKTWFQLLKGKLIDVCTATIIDKTIASEIYNGLANEVSNVTNYIDTQL